MRKQKEREQRAKKIVAMLKKMYPKPKSELRYHTRFHFVVAVILSAQCTDKAVNATTKTLFKKYKTVQDFATVSVAAFQKDIASIPFFRNKAKHIVSAAKNLWKLFWGPRP